MAFRRWMMLGAATALLAGQAWAGPVTSPKEALGHDIGEDYFLANYTQLESYLKTVAGQSDRIKLVDIGPTEEGRTRVHGDRLVAREPRQAGPIIATSPASSPRPTA
jgi:hypothetical protein